MFFFLTVQSKRNLLSWRWEQAKHIKSTRFLDILKSLRCYENEQYGAKQFAVDNDSLKN